MTIHPELQRYLDGEIARAALPPELQAEADRLTAAFASLQDDDAQPPSWLETRIMALLPAAPRAPWHQRILAAVLRPRTVRIRPLSAGLAAAAVAALAIVLSIPRAQQEPVSIAATDDTIVYVQFVFAAAEGSQSVAIAGDFNGWQPDAMEMRDPDGDGVWTALVGLKPGVHKYMFVVDGQWVTDPNAERHVDDGFGMRNAVLSVAAQS